MYSTAQGIPQLKAFHSKSTPQLTAAGIRSVTCNCDYLPTVIEGKAEERAGRTKLKTKEA